MKQYACRSRSQDGIRYDNAVVPSPYPIMVVQGLLTPMLQRSGKAPVQPTQVRSRGNHCDHLLNTLSVRIGVLMMIAYSIQRSNFIRDGHKMS